MGKAEKQSPESPGGLLKGTQVWEDPGLDLCSPHPSLLRHCCLLTLNQRERGKTQENSEQKRKKRAGASREAEGESGQLLLYGFADTEGDVTRHGLRPGRLCVSWGVGPRRDDHHPIAGPPGHGRLCKLHTWGPRPLTFRNIRFQVEVNILGFCPGLPSGYLICSRPAPKSSLFYLLVPEICSFIWQTFTKLLLDKDTVLSTERRHRYHIHPAETSVQPHKGQKIFREEFHLFSKLAVKMLREFGKEGKQGGREGKERKNTDLLWGRECSMITSYLAIRITR